MSRIRVAVTIEAPPEQVWAAIEDVTTHTRWMGDAERITFRGTRTHGVGTRFDCLTRIGPFAVVDEMAITAWEPRRRMGVVHEGLVTGSGTLRLRGRGRRSRSRRGEPRRHPRTRIVWRERLRFPWFMGGPFGAWAAAPIMVLLWRHSLRRLRWLVESGQLPDAPAARAALPARR
jgi:hypothetical protein